MNYYAYWFMIYCFLQRENPEWETSYERRILLNKTRLQAEFTKLKLKYKVKSVDQLPTKEADDDETPIRWFRINTIKIDIDRFYTKHPFFKQLQPVSSIDEITETGIIYSDDYIPNLFGVHPREKITSTEAYRLGK